MKIVQLWLKAWGICLFAILLALSVFRQKPSTAYWITSKGYYEGIGRLILTTPDNSHSRILTALDNYANSNSIQWSPDAKWIIYINHDEQRLYRIKPNGDDKKWLLENVQIDASPSWSPDGEWITLSYQNSSNPYNWDIYRIHPDGSNLELWFTFDDMDSMPLWSPNEKFILFLARTPESQGGMSLLRFDATTRNIQQIFFLGNLSTPVLWSPDSDYIALSLSVKRIEDNSPWNMYILSPDGSEIYPLSKQVDSGFVNDWSPDGQWILFSSNNELYRINPDGSALIQLTHAPKPSYDVGSIGAKWSPDSQWIAFSASYEDGWSVYLMRSDGSELHQIKNHSMIQNFFYDWSPLIDLAWHPLLITLLGMIAIVVSSSIGMINKGRHFRRTTPHSQ